MCLLLRILAIYLPILAYNITPFFLQEPHSALPVQCFFCPVLDDIFSLVLLLAMAHTPALMPLCLVPRFTQVKN